MSQSHKNPWTLSRFILKEQQRYPKAKGDLTILLNSIQLASKIIANAAKGAGIFNMYGLSGNENSSGDQVKKLDVFANDVMINSISFCGSVPIMASEELEREIMVKDCTDPKYCVVFDPLDGSSNIDANVSVGTIFGIHRIRDPKKVSVKEILQKGTDLICAGYTMYGDATLMVISFGNSVNGFTLDPQLGEFVLTHKNIKIPKSGNIYSVNEGNSSLWDQAVTKYVTECKNPKIGKPKKARYIGSMVADVHRTLLYGGIFMYPGSKSSPSGKLRLIYELNPMAFVIEAAGGLASTGRTRILGLQPNSIHEHKPCFLGSVKDVQRIEELYNELDETVHNE